MSYAALAFPSAPRVQFTENRGQWPEQVLFRALLPGGAVFVERDGLTYVLQRGGPSSHHGRPGSAAEQSPAVGHAYRMEFQGGGAQQVSTDLRLPHVENHFIGKDPLHWGTGCSVVGVVVLHDMWPGIHVRLDGRSGLKYDLILEPWADPEDVRLRYIGQDDLELTNGALIVSTHAGAVVEQAPVTFPERAPHERIRSRYRLEADVVSFALGARGTGRTIIDPVIAFGSYSGSVSDNFGYTATYDDDGNLYGAGIVFQPGNYPTTLGVFQPNDAGGIDVGITKWNATGTELIWSTFIGGAGNETPHSMVTNAQGELFLLGATGSDDLPVTPGVLDPVFTGGPAITNWPNSASGYGHQQLAGTDLFIAHFNAAATGLIGCTYLGGSGNDGLNLSTILAHNYGDPFRGEINLNSSGQPVVATSTYSNDMPVTANAHQPVYGGGQDGYICRLDAGLTTLLWGTFLGGGGDDNALGVQFDSAGEVFVSGGTTSPDLPMLGTSHQSTLAGGADGHLARFSPTGALLGATYMGTPAYDQAFFVQLDPADDVVVVGQTGGAMPISANVYAVPGSSQFIRKYDHTLSGLVWNTRVGNGNGAEYLSPTAFLVSECGQIYLSGWAGPTNGSVGNSQSTTTGWPTTADAYQSGTDGDDIFLMVLGPDAVELEYATFFGGPTSGEHVDGGTSRFDKDGTVYHAVCAGCGGNDDFPTSPGAWSEVNGSNNCNLGVFKFNLNPVVAQVGIDGPSTICTGTNAQFVNTSVGGTQYAWSFGDGSPVSNEAEPEHTYTSAGTYVVTMALTDPDICSIPDTARITITVLAPPVAAIAPIAPICPGSSVQLLASGGDEFSWSPTTGLSDPSVSDPLLTPPDAGPWTVLVTNLCGTDEASIMIPFLGVDLVAGPDTTICAGGTAVLSTTGGLDHVWSPSLPITDPLAGTTTATPDSTTTFTVTFTTPEGCSITDEQVVTVLYDAPVSDLADTTICLGDTVRITAGEALQYTWDALPGIAPLDVRSPRFFPSSSTLFFVTLTNTCGTVVDSVRVDVSSVEGEAITDTLVCPRLPFQLSATGGTSYSWTPTTGLNDPLISSPLATLDEPATYAVLISNEWGCTDRDSVTVDRFPLPSVEAGPDATITFGERVQLTAVGTGILSWTPDTWLEQPDGEAPISRPETSTTYTVTVTDTNGCKNSDQLTILVDGSLFVPNTFTPNGDGYNDRFGALGKDLMEFSLLLFDRWGVLLWSTEDIGVTWDGTYQGKLSPVDTYVWKVEAIDVIGRKLDSIGHVTLVR